MYWDTQYIAAWFMCVLVSFHYRVRVPAFVAVHVPRPAPVQQRLRLPLPPVPARFPRPFGIGRLEHQEPGHAARVHQEPPVAAPPERRGRAVWRAPRRGLLRAHPGLHPVAANGRARAASCGPLDVFKPHFVLAGWKTRLFLFFVVVSARAEANKRRQGR